MKTYIKEVLENMLFSIIIPAYNEEQSLPACLASLKEQTLSNDQYEIIVIDNGSTDKTTEIAEGFAVKLIVNEEKNVSGLRNLGAENAQGDVLAFIDADCTAYPDWLTAASKYIRDKSIAAWGSPPGVPENASWVQKSWFNLRKKTQKIIAVDWLESMNLFVRKETFSAVNGFNETLVTCEDVDFCYRVGEKGKIIADSNIKVIHFGEAVNIREFIKKEFWRGISNYKGLFSHSFKLSELPSFMLPLYFGIFLPLIIGLALFIPVDEFKVLAIAAFILPAIAVWFKLLKKKLTFFEQLQLLYLIHVYFIVRTVSAFKGLVVK